MSGIAGIVNLDGGPVDREILEEMASLLAYRGPDRTGIWQSGPVGLVHTLFATTHEAHRERQPIRQDGKVWITADARLDGREALVAELRGRGCRCTAEATDPELILEAYVSWGESCVEHLLGDFAFALWDGAERKLFCARDHFGVRPFFYAHEGNVLIFSNAFDAPRLHPDVPDDLWEPGIGDFLALGQGYDFERTVRAAIRRLAPAHVLMAADGQVRMRRYWSLPIDPPTVYRRPGDYMDRFLELFEQAVADRLRTDRAAILMSGGLDSSAVAAMARRVADKQGGRCRLTAHTQTFDRLIPYEEGPLASLVAKEIGIPWKAFPLDDKQMLGYWDQPKFRRAEPWKTPLYDWHLADVLGKPLPARVVLTGQGSDGAFSSLRGRHVRDRIRQRQWLQLGREVAGHLLCEGRIRRLRLWGHVRARFVRPPVPANPFPCWLNPDFDRSLHLRERYEEQAGRMDQNAGPPGAVRPEAHDLMSAPSWPQLFEEYDPDTIGACVEARHPFFDLRLMRYVLSLPALPWCSDKELLRRSMRGMLPNQVRLARKRPILVDLLGAHFRASQKPWLEPFVPEEELSRYVDVEKAVQYGMAPPAWELAVHIRPFALNFWLKWERQYAYKVVTKKEGLSEHTQ